LLSSRGDPLLPFSYSNLKLNMLWGSNSKKRTLIS
jgi:hypothetical protein